MRDLLPPEVISRLLDRYMTGVADAIENYDQSCADEDALTGALGQAIATRIPLDIPTPLGIVQVKIGYTKLRGRGNRAAEKLYGSDGLFQIEVVDSSGRIVRRKGLPFQSKKDWHGTNSKLASQAATMIKETGSGIVIDYKHNGYFACDAATVVRCRGKRGVAQQSGKLSSLGRALGTDFLECRIGTVGLSYDAIREQYDWDTEPAHLITMVVSGPFPKTDA